MNRDYLISFMEEFDYPAEARRALLEAFDRAEACPAAKTAMEENRRLFNLGAFRGTGYSAELNLVTRAARDCGAHEYTVHLLFYILLSEDTRAEYLRRGIGMDIFHATMNDLHTKLMECYAMCGIWGSFVSGWFKGFFELNRFALGRLQFEIIHAPFDYEKDGHAVKKGEEVLNVHIPSEGGPLTREALDDAYARAAAFYRPLWPGKPLPISCHSWLLFPGMQQFMPKDSHILLFQSDFDIFEEEDDPKFGDCWRLYYRDYDGHPENLPRNTRMQRGFADWLMAGQHAGFGRGIFFYTKDMEGQA